jgi:hypothetical protein
MRHILLRMDEDKVKYLIENGKDITLLDLLQNFSAIRASCEGRSQYIPLEQALARAIETEYPDWVNWRSPFFSIWPEKRPHVYPIVSRSIKEKYCRVLLYQWGEYDKIGEKLQSTQPELT